MKTFVTIAVLASLVGCGNSVTEKDVQGVVQHSGVLAMCEKAADDAPDGGHQKAQMDCLKEAGVQ